MSSSTALDPVASSGSVASPGAAGAPGVRPIPDADTIALLRGAVLVLARRLRRQRADDDLSATEVAVLGRVYRDGPSTPGALARAEHVQPPSMTRIIERLEQRGLPAPRPGSVRRSAGPGVRTPRAANSSSRNRGPCATAWLATQIDKLDEADRAALAAAAPALARLADLA